MAELPSGLLEAVRNNLDILWVDDAGDTKLSGIIARGIKHLDNAAGAACDYTVEDKPRELLMEYCRYARSNALDEFQGNYLHELLSLQHTVAITERITKTQLSALAIGALTLSPVFSVAIYDYTAMATDDSDAITATLAYKAAELSITVNGAPIDNGGTASWDAGDNVVVVSVTNGELSLPYTVVITR